MHTITEHQIQKVSASYVMTLFLGLIFLSNSAFAQIPQIPQIPAFLPTIDQVPASQVLPLDGTWIVTSIGKKIRIQAGRAYALDSWLHMFVLKVQPGMVVQKNIVPTGPGKYSGEDLPLMGKYTATVQADRSINVSVPGILGTVNYKLVPVQIDNQQWFDQEMRAAGLSPSVNQSTQTSIPTYQVSPPPGVTAPAPVYQPAPAAPAYGYQVQPAVTPPATSNRPVSNQPIANCRKQLYDSVTGQFSCAD